MLVKLKIGTTNERFKFFSFVIFIENLLVGFFAFVPVRPESGRESLLTAL